jgi:nucleotide-binding universal stress UspA family protein
MKPTIIVPLDGSAAAENALPFAVTLAERQGSPIMLTSVVAVTDEFATWLNTGVDERHSEIGAWVEDRRTYLKGLIEEMRGSDIHAHVSVGRPTNMLIEFIEQDSNAVVVMASHGREQPEKGAVGRHTLRLLHHLRAPVFVIKNLEDGGIPITDGIHRVLIPIDGSTFSEQAIDATLELLGNPAPSIHLVSVIEHTGVGAFDTKVHESARDANAERLERHARALTDRGHVTTWEVRAGEPEVEIVTAAMDSQATLIAMTTHGRTGIAATLLGSVAEGVLHGARHPLLLIRPGRD